MNRAQFLISIFLRQAWCTRSKRRDGHYGHRKQRVTHDVPSGANETGTFFPGVSISLCANTLNVLMWLLRVRIGHCAPCPVCPRSDRIADMAGGPVRADCVEKVFLG